MVPSHLPTIASIANIPFQPQDQIINLAEGAIGGQGGGGGGGVRLFAS